MAVATAEKAAPRSHKATVAPLARDVAERNEAAWFDAHEDAISAMEALHELELPADATAEQRQQKREAFLHMSAVARIAAKLETLNTTYLLMKGDSTATNNAIADVDKLQRERKANRK